MSVNEIRYFIFENYYKQIGFSAENSYYLTKRWKKRFIASCKEINRKLPDSCNAKEHYQSFIRKEKSKSQRITYQPKSFENPNIVDIKSVIMQHSKISHALSKSIKTD